MLKPDKPFRGFTSDRVSRRRLLLSPPVLMAPRLLAQTARPTIRVRGINHVTLAVSDVRRSVDFYQGLFGMPVISRQGDTTNLRIGDGPRFLGVSAADSGAPRIDRFCLGVEAFDLERVMRILAQHDVRRADAATGGGPSGGPMRMRLRLRGPDAGARRKERRSSTSPIPTACRSSCRTSAIAAVQERSAISAPTRRLALLRGAAYSQHAVIRPFIDAEEKIDRMVGRRSKPAAGLSTVTSHKTDSLAWRRSFGGVRVPRGVYRFKTHEEADEWLWRMIARPTS